jgi:hypothetical protein
MITTLEKATLCQWVYGYDTDDANSSNNVAPPGFKVLQPFYNSETNVLSVLVGKVDANGNVTDPILVDRGTQFSGLTDHPLATATDVEHDAGIILGNSEGVTAAEQNYYDAKDYLAQAYPGLQLTDFTGQSLGGGYAQAQAFAAQQGGLSGASFETFAAVGMKAVFSDQLGQSDEQIGSLGSLGTNHVFTTDAWAGPESSIAGSGQIGTQDVLPGPGDSSGSTLPPLWFTAAVPVVGIPLSLVSLFGSGLVAHDIGTFVDYYSHKPAGTTLADSISAAQTSANGTTELTFDDGTKCLVDSNGGGSGLFSTGNGEYCVQGISPGSLSFTITGTVSAPSYAGNGDIIVPTDAGTYHIDPATKTITDQGAVTTTVNGNTVTLITPPPSNNNGASESKFAVIQSTDATASSSNILNILAYPQGPAPMAATRSQKRRLGSLWISHDRGRRGTGGRAPLCGFIRRDEHSGSDRPRRLMVRGRSSGRMVAGFARSEHRFHPTAVADSAWTANFRCTRRLPVTNGPGRMSSLRCGTTHGCAHDVSFGFGGLG